MGSVMLGMADKMWSSWGIQGSLGVVEMREVDPS